MADAARKPHVFWTDEETKALIALWAENIDELRRTKRNRHIYAKVQEQLFDVYCVTHTIGEIKTKIDNLSKLYRKVKQKLTPGGSPSTWRYYEQIDLILGQNNSLLIESTTGNYQCASVVSCELNENGHQSLSPVHSSCDDRTNRYVSTHISTSEAASDSEASCSFANHSFPKRRKSTNTSQLINIVQTLCDRQGVLDNALLENAKVMRTLLQEHNDLQKQMLQMNAVVVDLMKKLVEKV